MPDPLFANTPNAALKPLAASELDAKPRVEDHAVSVSLAPAAPRDRLRPKYWSRGLALAAGLGLAGGAAIAARAHSNASKPRNNGALLAEHGPVTLPLVTIIGEPPVVEAAPLTLPVVTIIAEPPTDVAPGDGSRIATTADMVTPATLPASTTTLATSPASLSR